MYVLDDLLFERKAFATKPNTAEHSGVVDVQLVASLPGFVVSLLE
jgi:hypothetical protein